MFSNAHADACKGKTYFVVTLIIFLFKWADMSSSGIVIIVSRAAPPCIISLIRCYKHTHSSLETLKQGAGDYLEFDA